MPVIEENSDTEENQRSHQTYLRLQNLPWTACLADIRQFFQGLSIKKGGIFVRNFEAFITFENPADTRLALYRRNILLHGSKMELSVIDEKELLKVLFYIARRKLDFEQLGKSESTLLHSRAMFRRKIRPTPVLKGQKLRQVSSSIFLPDETLQHDRYHADEENGDRRHDRFRKRTANGIRKVHPTTVTQCTTVENFAVFHPEECYEVKRLKLEG